MKKTIMIDGKPVKFSCTAGTLLLYRELFEHGMMEDAQALVDRAKNGNLDDDSIEILARIAYTMAKEADPTAPDNMREWLRQYELISFYSILPEIIALWSGSASPTVTAKKK